MNDRTHNETTCGACTVAIGAHTFNEGCVADYSEHQYEQALKANGFLREDAMTSYHVITKNKHGDWYNINEGAARDMFDTRREALADLIATREWEDAQLV